MNIEQMVTSLEWSKKLKEAGVPQVSCFHSLEGDDTPFRLKIGNEYRQPKNAISRFLAVELLRWLPEYIKRETGEVLEDLYEGAPKKYNLYSISIGKNSSGEWFISYERSAEDALFYVIDKAFPNACAKCLHYLIKEKLVKLEG